MSHASSDGPPTLSEYQLRLPAYEGPLDVLLRLIERSRLAIEDVSLVAVTHQFLRFVEDLIEASPDVVAEFTAVGARLTVLKSRSLLPTPPAAEEEIQESDLTEQLREYKRIKYLAAHLQSVHASGTASYLGVLRGAVELPGGAATFTLANQDATSLLRSLRRRLSVVPRPATILRQRPLISLHELVVHIGECVDHLTRVQFSVIVEDYHGRAEVATAFLAVLVLVRRQSISASQGDVFGEIQLSQQREPVTTDIGGGPEDERLFAYEGDTGT